MIERRETDELSARLDTQDKLLREILSRMADHKKEHEAVDPPILELVNILKGIKFLKGAFIFLASCAGSVWVAWVWAKDHIKL